MSEKARYTVIQTPNHTRIDDIVVHAFRESLVMQEALDIGRNKTGEIISLSVPTRMLHGQLKIDRGLRSIIESFDLELIDILPAASFALGGIRVSQPLPGKVYASTVMSGGKTANVRTVASVNDTKARLEGWARRWPGIVLLGGALVPVGIAIKMGCETSRLIEYAAELNKQASDIRIDQRTDGLDSAMKARSGSGGRTIPPEHIFGKTEAEKGKDKKPHASQPTDYRKREDDRRNQPPGPPKARGS